MTNATKAAPREPTEAMLIAARDWSYKAFGKPIGSDAATGCWQVMFDAIPAETPDQEALRAAREAIVYADECFEAALCEGLREALADNDGERVHDLWSRRLSFARDKFPAALAILDAATPAPDERRSPGPPFAFDRYINGELRAEGVVVEKATTLEEAMPIAVRLCRRRPGDVAVLVLRDAPDERRSGDEIRAEIERCSSEEVRRLNYNADNRLELTLANDARIVALEWTLAPK